MRHSIQSFIKRCLPTNLYGRALLILILPIILVQIIVAYVFYERHWNQIVRQLSGSLVQEVAYIYSIYANAPDEQSLKEAKFVARQMGMKLQYDASQKEVIERDYNTRSHNIFTQQMKQRIVEPFIVKDSDKQIELRILMDRGTLVFTISRKRLASVTTDVFVLSMIGATTVFLIISVLFLRNQIRPIKQLAKASEQFGMGQNTQNFQPRGAREVRQAGHAFIVMRNRIERFITTRTDMLSGISHDLRTPLTRMRLQLEMAANKPETIKRINEDITQMEHMINEYLEFAQGNTGEPSMDARVDILLLGIVEKYQYQQKEIELEMQENVSMVIKPNALRRAIQNIIDNALRYGTHVKVMLVQTEKNTDILIEDNGPGIEEQYHETVFQPFTRLDKARNLSHAGVGLGLSIARDSVMMQGGKIELENIKNTQAEIQGLRVKIRL